MPSEMEIWFSFPRIKKWNENLVQSFHEIPRDQYQQVKFLEKFLSINKIRFLSKFFSFCKLLLFVDAFLWQNSESLNEVTNWE